MCSTWGGDFGVGGETDEEATSGSEGTAVSAEGAPSSLATAFFGHGASRDLTAGCTLMASIAFLSLS